MFIALEIDQCRQHLVTKSGKVWSHDDSAMAEHVLYGVDDAGTQNILSSMSTRDVVMLCSMRHAAFPGLDSMTSVKQ